MYNSIGKKSLLLINIFYSVLISINFWQELHFHWPEISHMICLSSRWNNSWDFCWFIEICINGTKKLALSCLSWNEVVEFFHKKTFVTSLSPLIDIEYVLSTAPYDTGYILEYITDCQRYDQLIAQLETVWKITKYCEQVSGAIRLMRI